MFIKQMDFCSAPRPILTTTESQMRGGGYLIVGDVVPANSKGEKPEESFMIS